MTSSIKESFYCPKWEEPIKVGDTIRRIRQETPWAPIGFETTAIHVYKEFVTYIDKDGGSSKSLTKFWEKVPMSDKCKCLDIEAAKSLLEAQGFTVSEPKTGRLFISESLSGYGRYYTDFKLNSNLYRTLAIIDWKQGDGL